MSTSPSTGAPSETPGDAGGPPATVVDLTAGPAQITPLEVDGETRYALDLPSEHLDDDDLESLAVALHATHSGQAVLVDLEDYAGAEEEAAPGEDAVPGEDAAPGKNPGPGEHAAPEEHTGPR
ncbi:hypothetical protein AUQ48_09170 [Kocuria flava]|uniref:Uncharacterized protein n=1 Tax=Kocuria flava TaxID=446860 RepID=A0A2N4T2B3_9MICC|nr:hypothetical protein [Kocuria flava]PLC12379.1 hypothetical protein AUQ48_09170 [Kocuria flava]